MVGHGVAGSTPCPAQSPVVVRRLGGRRPARRGLGQNFRIIDPNPMVGVYGDLSGRRNLQRWRVIAHHRITQARRAVSFPCNALKARSQPRCPSRKIAVRNQVFAVDAGKPRGLIMTTAILGWRRGGGHHGHDHGNHKDCRESAHWFCHGHARLSFQVPVYSMPKLDSSLARTCLVNQVGPGRPIPGAFEPSSDRPGQPCDGRVRRLVGVFA